MNRSACSVVWLAAILATTSGVLPGAFSEIDVIEPPEGIQTGEFVNFPYCRCDRSQSAYSIAPTVIAKGGGQYCFTLLVRPCNSTCCRVDLKKIEIDVYAACAVKSATVKATLNSVFTAVGPNFYFAYQGPAPWCCASPAWAWGWAATAPRSASPSSPAGTTPAATPSRSCASHPPARPPACATSPCSTATTAPAPAALSPLGGLPKPPPPPPSPRPPAPYVPPPPPPCDVCIHMLLVPPLLDFPPFRFNNLTCSLIQQALIGPISAQIAALGIQPIKNFTVDASLCSELEIQICATFAFVADAQALQAFLQVQINILVSLLTANVCPATSGGYSIRVFAGETDCIFLEAGSDCTPEDDLFPYCKCNKTQYVTPTFVQPTVTTRPGSATSTLYCFELGIIPDAIRVPSNFSAGISKVEIWAVCMCRRRPAQGGQGLSRLHPNEPSGALHISYLRSEGRQYCPRNAIEPQPGPGQRHQSMPGAD